MKKDLAIIGGLFLAVAFLVIFGRQFTSSQFINPAGPGESTRQAARKDTTGVAVRDLKIEAILADEADERKEGLSDRDGLPISQGMLFVFDKSDTYAIWMKDMKFPIDIIWIDDSPAHSGLSPSGSMTGEKKIVDIAQNAVPEPGKDDEELKIYRPKGQAKYVLEINAGLSKLHDLQAGDTVSFEL